MSDHGTFITQEMSCPKCEEALSAVLVDSSDITDVHTFGDPRRRVLVTAGQVSTSICGGEYLVFDTELRYQVEPKLCHTMSVAVLGEDGRVHAVEFKPSSEVSA